MNKLYALGRRSVLAGAALLLGFGVVLPPLFLASSASAVAQVTSRSITMSSSAASATSVTYAVNFTPATTGSIGGIVVDFCDNDPLIGDTSCTVPAGFTVGASPSFSITSGIATGGTWSASSLNSGQVFELSNATAQAVTAGTPAKFSITSVTNPSTANHSFYARIITFDTSAHMTTNYTVAGTTRASTFTGEVDYGGDALSTSSSINITAKVFETLSFCVYTGSCGGAPTLTLGDPVTGALSTSNTYVANAKYDLATNAGSGVSIVVKGTTLCNTVGAACQSGTASANTITPVTTTPTVFSTNIGTEQFGMCGDINSSAALIVDAPYIDSVANCHGISNGILATANKFGFDNTNVTGASGSEVIHSTGAVPAITGGFAFAANIAPTTEAGIYTTSLNMVATSTF